MEIPQVSTNNKIFLFHYRVNELDLDHVIRPEPIQEISSDIQLYYFLHLKSNTRVYLSTAIYLAQTNISLAYVHTFPVASLHY